MRNRQLTRWDEQGGRQMLAHEELVQPRLCERDEAAFARAAARARIIVVDDHPLVLEGLRAVLHGESAFDVVGQAGSGAATLAAARQDQPDISLLDITLPDCCRFG